MVAPPSALTTAPLAPSGAGAPAPRTLLPLARLLPALAALTSQLLASFLAALVLLFKSGDAAAAGGTAVVSLRMECSVETTDDDDAPLPTRHAVVSATKRFRLRPAAGSAPALDAPTKPGAIALRAIVLHAPKTATARPCAFLTLLTRDSYLPGVQALARSLHAVGTRHPLLVMHTGALTPEAAAALAREPGCHLVQHYQPEGSHDPTRYKLAAYGECWCKLQMWGLEEYGRLAYLDADMVVRRNIDALFSLPEGFYAVPDCAFGRASAAERDACSYFTPHVPHYFNAGFFLMRPSAAELRRFRALLAAGAVEIGAFAEQARGKARGLRLERGWRREGGSLHRIAYLSLGA
eukprot:scaffold6.g2734.t1